MYIGNDLIIVDILINLVYCRNLSVSINNF